MGSRDVRACAVETIVAPPSAWPSSRIYNQGFRRCMELNLVMLGPPGAGKGTQARQLRRKWHIPPISTGAMLREAVQAGTPLGREVAVIMESGDLISDHLITPVAIGRSPLPDREKR